MDLFYSSSSAYHVVLALWCCTVWRNRARRVPFLIPAFYAHSISIALCIALRPHLTPVAYGWLYIAVSVAANLSFALVLFGIWRTIRPPLSTSVFSVVAVLVPVALVWSSAWLYTAIMIWPLALGMALSLTCALASRRKETPSDGDYSRQFAITGFALYFSVQFASIAGLFNYFRFRDAANVLVEIASAVAWLIIAWGLRLAPARSQARYFERRIADATRMLWRNLL